MKPTPPPSGSAATEAGAVAALPAAGREDVTFLSSGTACAAWLYRPESVGAVGAASAGAAEAAGVGRNGNGAGATHATGALPVVIIAHGLGATRQLRLDAYARRFVAAGYAALVFDYRGFGASDGSPRQIVDVPDQLDDWHAALAYVRAHPELDSERIVVWGTSFGGGHALRIAADDGNIAAAIAQCPFTDGIASLWRRFLTNPMSATVVMVAAWLDLLGSVLGRKPLLLPMAGTSFMPAFLASEDSLSGASALATDGTRLSGRTSRTVARIPFVRRRLSSHLEPGDTVVPKGIDSIWGVLVSPDGSHLVNAIAARLAVKLAFYRPARAVKRTGDTPILICACDFDTVAPVGPTVRAGRGRANVQVNRYPYGHFSIYLDDAFERAIGDQIAFLQQHVPVAAA